jgi:hypothetical protein
LKLNVLLVASFLSLALTNLSSPGRQDVPEPLFLVSQDGKSGFINQTGMLVIPAQFASASDFHEGRTCAVPDDRRQLRYQLIDEQGKAITAAEFSACGEFSEGLGAIAFDTEKTQKSCMDCDPFYHWGYIGEQGEVVIRPQFHSARKFSEGLAAVQNDGGKWGYVNKNGTMAVSFQFDYASSFSEGVAVVVTHQKYGYIDRNGMIVLSARFTQASDFSEGLALTKTGGKFVSPMGMWLGTESDERTEFEYIDKSGKVRFRLKGEHASSFAEGLAEFGVVKDDGYLYCGYVDKAGRKIIEPQFGGCDSFSEGLANVLVNGKWHFIDKAGHFVIDPPFFQVRSFHNGLAFFLDGQSRSSASGYIDKTGKVVWPRQ